VSFVGLCHISTWPAARTHARRAGCQAVTFRKSVFFLKKKSVSDSSLQVVASPPSAYAGFAGNGHPTLLFPSPFPFSSGLPDPDYVRLETRRPRLRPQLQVHNHTTHAAQARLAQLRHAFPPAAAGPVADGPRPQNAGRNAVADASLETTLRRLSFRSAMAGPHCFPNCVGVGGGGGGGFRPNTFGLGHHQPRKEQTGFERTAGSANAVSHQTSSSAGTGPDRTGPDIAAPDPCESNV
jgi:hypothetical protein